MKESTLNVISSIFSYYATPVSVAPVVNGFSQGVDVGTIIGMLQTAGGVSEMIGLNLSLPAAISLAGLGLFHDSSNIISSLADNGKVKVADILSAEANLSAIAGSLALAAAVGSVAAPVLVGVAVLATVSGIAFTLAALRAGDSQIDFNRSIDAMLAIRNELFNALGESYSNALNACAELVGSASVSFDELLNKFADGLFGFSMSLNGIIMPVEQSVADLFNSAMKWVPRRDPLTLDLDGDGLETISKAPDGSPILFDHDGDGIKNGTGWVGSDDGFLVLDRNGNGLIDNGGELFGDSTLLADGTKAADGFAALADQDSNHDGHVDALDGNWANLRVWRDLNQDGISQTAELMTLSQLGIAGFVVEKTANNQVLSNGNQIADLGSYIRSDGSAGTMGDVGQMADINLMDDTFHRQFTDHVPLAPGVEALPEMQGSGLVRDLREAASQSTSLQSLLAQYSQATSRDAQLALLDQLLVAWADTSGMQDSLDDRVGESYRVQYLAFGNMTRGGNQVPGDGSTPSAVDIRDVDNEVLTASYRQLIADWNRKISVLESFNGRYFFAAPNESQAGSSAVFGLTTLGSGGGYGVTPSYQLLGVSYSADQLVLLQKSYDALRQSVYDSLLLQTRFKPALDLVNIQITSDGVGLDFSAVSQYFRDKITLDSSSGVVDLLDFNRVARSHISDAIWEGESLLADVLGDLQLTPEQITLLGSFRASIIGQNGANGQGTADGDLMFGSVGADTISGKAGSDVIYAGAGNDEISGGTEDDHIFAGTGDDRIYAGTGNDVLEGGSGNDTFNSGYDAAYGDVAYGNDTYLFGRGDGQDTIYEHDATAGNLDTIRFKAGVTPADVVLMRSHTHANDLIIQIRDTTDSITVVNYYAHTNWRVERLAFEDGATWGVEVLDKVTIFGSSGAEVVMGTTVGETYDGLAGNDTFNSGYDAAWGSVAYGNDTYLFGRGDGQDTIYPCRPQHRT